MNHHKRLNLDARFQLGFVINTAFMLFEFAVAFASGSLILIADAVHNLTDSVTLAISWLGSRLAKKPADDDHTLGHGRVSVFAALTNSIILVIVAMGIFYEAYQRFTHPQPLQGGVIAVVGLVGLVANASVAFLFRKNRNDLNVKAAFTNMLFDAIFSVAAFVAGVLITFTHRSWIDPLISIGVGIGLLYAAFGIVGQAMNIFFEGVPKDVNVADIKKILLQNAHVQAVEELAVWAISSNEYVLCCVLVLETDDHSRHKQTVAGIKEVMRQSGVTKVYIEIS